jgi:hypothetical protein
MEPLYSVIILVEHFNVTGLVLVEHLLIIHLQVVSTGATQFTNGVTANTISTTTISATTYLNLPSSGGGIFCSNIFNNNIKFINYDFFKHNK